MMNMGLMMGRCGYAYLVWVGWRVMRRLERREMVGIGMGREEGERRMSKSVQVGGTERGPVKREEEFGWL